MPSLFFWSLRWLLFRFQLAFFAPSLRPQFAIRCCNNVFGPLQGALVASSTKTTQPHF